MDDGLPQRREIDLILARLPVEHPLFLHVERDDGELSELWLPRNPAQDGYQRESIHWAKGGGIEVLGAEIHQELDIQGRGGLLRATGGSSLNCSN